MGTFERPAVEAGSFAGQLHAQGGFRPDLYFESNHQIELELVKYSRCFDPA